MNGRPARVLLMTEQTEPGGKRSHVDALLAGLLAIGWDARGFDANHLSLLERAFIAGPNYALELLHRAAGHLWIVPAAHAVYSRRLRAYARGWAPDVWHAQESITFRAVRAASGGRPVALTVHGPMHREVASAYRVPLENATIRRLREIERRSFLEADAVISVDLNHADYVRSFGRSERLWVIPNFVDTRRFHPDVAAATLPADVETWCAGRPVLLCPRRLVPKNGVDVALRAARALADRGVAAAMLIAGDGPQHEPLSALHRQLGLEDSVRMLGGIDPDAMPGLCRRAAAVLVPSIRSAGVEEATSISALEAQACARPVIASELGGLREIVVHERTGLLFPPGDDDALALSIARVLADEALASTLGERACAHVREHHSHIAGARQYAGVYAELGVETAG